MDVKLVFIFLIFLIFSCYSCHSIKDNEIEQNFKVIKVIDGDTFWIGYGKESKEKIRLIGVDAPESRKAFKKEIGHYGKESKLYLTNLLLGRRVKLEYDIDYLDRFGRTLAYVYLEDGTFVNAELVKEGYAMVMTIPPNVKFAEMFVKLQQEARENNRGLWGKEAMETVE